MSAKGDEQVGADWEAVNILEALADLLSQGHDDRNGDSRENVVKQVRRAADSLRGQAAPEPIDAELIRDWRRTLSGILFEE